MAAKVTSSRAGLVTRDLLGGHCTVDSKELDLHLQGSSGFENSLHMKSGKLYLQKCSSQNSTSSTIEQKQGDGQMHLNFDDLHHPPVVQRTLNLLGDGSLDLKLVPLALSSPSLSTYQSVCTLDKVKSALERADKETKRKRSLSLPSSSSSSLIEGSEIDEEDNSPATFATGCPRCLLYVLISKSDPKCPRCRTVLRSLPTLKKPRIDLNISI